MLLRDDPAPLRLGNDDPRNGPNIAGKVAGAAMPPSHAPEPKRCVASGWRLPPTCRCAGPRQATRCIHRFPAPLTLETFIANARGHHRPGAVQFPQSI